MKAGQLRHRVTLQAVTDGVGTAGGPTETWADLATVWAAVEPVLNRVDSTEYQSAQQVEAQALTRIRIRYRAGLTPKHRVLWGARVFNILVVNNVDERNIELHLMCRELL